MPPPPSRRTRRDEDRDDEREAEPDGTPHLLRRPVALWIAVAGAAGSLLLGCTLGLMLGRPSSPAILPAGVASPPSAIDQAEEYKFGEEAIFGELRVTIAEARSGTVAGQYRRRFASTEKAYLTVSVKNTSTGKVGDWPGWHGVAKLVDEHGNQFETAPMRDWAWLPGNYSDDQMNGDTGARVHPGKTYKDLLYFEPIPKTSQEVVLMAPLGGRVVRFRGSVKRDR